MDLGLGFDDLDTLPADRKPLSAAMVNLFLRGSADQRM
jgi:hypothetical protein